jgi:NAD(P)-dependent dehydrogenase (short-subunit alcohol dehydrogenase family)
VTKGEAVLLENKVAIITGAGTGIGEAIAHKFAREGARLALGGLRATPLQTSPRQSSRTAEAAFRL